MNDTALSGFESICNVLLYSYNYLLCRFNSSIIGTVPEVNIILNKNAAILQIQIEI